MPASDSSYLHIPTIPSDFLGQMVAHLDIGRQLPLRLQQRLSELLIQDKLTISQYGKFYQDLRLALRDEMIGMFPLAVPLGSQQVLCQMLCHSPDTYTALENYNRYYSLFLNGGAELLDLSLLRSEAKIIVSSCGAHSTQAMFQQSLFLALLKIPSWLTAQKLSPKVLQFGFKAMPFASEFNYLFGITPNYECSEVMLQFHQGDLDKPIQGVEAAESFGQHFILHTLYWSANEDIARRVYSEIALRLNGGKFDVVQLAAHFNISKHTLARRLKAASTSYGQLLERVRRDKALHLLLNSQVSVDDIAEQLGFQELGSFSRAFKGWCGCSPSQCRQAATNC